jgi:hypothetical protein
LAALCLEAGISRAQVRINEVMAAPGERLLMADEQGRMRPGSGMFWTDPGFVAPGWKTGAAPLGFGGAAGLGTNVSSVMQNRTPNLYLRRIINLSPAQAANEGLLQLRIKFDDGFIAWVNGREVARSNAGPVGHYVYADQKAYNFAAATTNGAYTPATQTGTAPTALNGVLYSLGKVTDLLRAGENVLAIQLINRDPDVSARVDAQLETVTANVVLDLARHNFNDANDSARMHRNLGGSVTNTSEGTIPANSWLGLAADAQSSSSWSDLTMRAALVTGAGYEGTGALRLSYSQTDAANQPASFSGPVLSMASQMAPGSLTQARLADLRLTFRLRASANASCNIRLDPDGNSPASSLTAMAVLNSTAGTGVNQDAADAFDDAVNGKRTRTVSAAGSATTTSTAAPATIKNTIALLSGAAMRDGIFTLLEDATPGAGTGALPGALEFEVAKSPATPDFFGFSYQSVVVRSWTATAVTPLQLKSGALTFDYQMPAGVSYSVYLESAPGAPTAADRLSLGTITGTGAWRNATLDTGSAGNQTAFLTYLNGVGTNTVRVVFISNSNTLPAGSRLTIDNIGYSPWRTYNVALSTASNSAAFIDAINAQPSPQVVPVFEKTGIATAPLSATVTLDDLALTLTKTNAGAASIPVPYASAGWSYYPGLAEPSGGLVEPADFTPAPGTGSFADWIELFNEGSDAVDLGHWALTDERGVLAKYLIPAGTTLAAGASLVIVADNRSAPARAAWLHAPFSLGSNGEYLALSNSAGAIVDALDPGYPPQDSFHSWGRDPVTRQWGYLRTATPGQPNTGVWQAGIAEAPAFSIPGGFYTGVVKLELGSPSPEAVIRYTIDGSEPTATNGQTYSTPLNLSVISDRIGHVITARSLVPGMMPSPVVVNTYLINQHPSLRTAPAVLLSGEAGRTFYKPLGIFAIQGGTYDAGVWGASLATDYNIPVGDGRLTDPDSGSRPYERPSFLEYCYPDNRPGIRENIGLRVSSSPYSRPRLVLNDVPSKTLWDANATLKPSFNIFFRSDYGSTSIHHALIPETEVRHFEEFRLRAGKNDISNPFIRDEFIRRLWTDMGHEGTVGRFASVYLNGYFKGYYNLVERIREPFMQSHHRSSEAWDVNYIGVFEDGDSVHWDTVLQPRLNADLSVKANWDALRQVLDVTNFADYILLNTWSAMWDWPHNNWAMARERSATGIWRCYVWDAEGGYDMGGKGPAYQTLRDDLLSTAGVNNNTPIPVMFRRMMTSPEFRLLFADRIQKHLFNGGALTDSKTSPRRVACQAEVSPLMSLAGLTPDTSWFTNWINPTTGRRATLFPNASGTIKGQFRDPNQDNSLSDTLWPLTLPPAFSQHGGTVAAGFALSITHTAPAGSAIYYTVDGSDPRSWGGVVAASARTYNGPISFSASSTTVRTRVRNATTNEWSPLTEARFALATVPATAANTIISEIMFNPPALTTVEASAGYTDAQEFEYIVLQNIGTAPVDLTALRFQFGITFGFDVSSRPVLDPGQRCLLAKNASALRLRYGAGIDAVLVGEYFGSLKNEGELIRLEVASNSTPVKAFNYDEAAPWPTAADGHGSSLVLVNPGSNPDPDLPASWTASAAPGGNPTGTPPVLSYQTWAAWSFSPVVLADLARSGPQADADLDGLPNLVEWLLGTDPQSAAPVSPVSWSVQLGRGGTHVLQISFPRLPAPAVSGYTLVVESSSDLVNWQADLTLAGTVPLPNGASTEIWEKIFPGGTACRYVRLRALPQP